MVESIGSVLALLAQAKLLTKLRIMPSVTTQCFDVRVVDMWPPI